MTPEERKAYDKNYREINRIERNLKAKEWYQAHKEHKKEYYEKQKLINNQV